MFKFNPFKRKKPSRSDANCLPGANFLSAKKLVENQLEIKIGDILIRITRCTDIPPQNELTAVIPRAEIRRRRYENGQLVGAEEEIILSSITLVDSPRHPPEKSDYFNKSRSKVDEICAGKVKVDTPGTVRKS